MAAGGARTSEWRRLAGFAECVCVVAVHSHALLEDYGAGERDAAFPCAPAAILPKTDAFCVWCCRSAADPDPFQELPGDTARGAGAGRDS